MDMLSAELTKKSNNMIEYLIKSYHEIYVDDYNEGELDMVNVYIHSAKVFSNSPIDAIKDYFNTQLHYSFDESLVCTDAEDSLNVVWYNIMVNQFNDEAEESEIELWKKGELTLYNNSIRIEIYKVTPVRN